MNTESNASPPIAATPFLPTRPFFWSVRRELWENRSIYLAPLIAAGVVLFGFGITAFGLPQRRLNALALE
ncbi:MAG: ABC transporter permease, partial [Verrucomicrobiota bacterium]|nr:ABC transporter permease [Verrucomicrobiota bacterium]